MIPATAAEQRRLFDLQQVDTAIRQLQHRRANLPEQRALDEHVDTLTRIGAELIAARDQLERLTAQQRRHENEVATVDARRKSEEGRMFSGLIRSERELDALKGELSSLRSRKNDLEDTLLEIMEQREDTESLVATLTARQHELTGQVTELTVARDEAATDIDAALQDRRKEREDVAAGVHEEALSYYTDLRARKDGVAVAQLQGRTCQGCRLELTAIELEDVRAAADRALARCEQCGRILVIV